MQHQAYPTYDEGAPPTEYDHPPYSYEDEQQQRQQYSQYPASESNHHYAPAYPADPYPYPGPTPMENPFAPGNSVDHGGPPDRDSSEVYRRMSESGGAAGAFGRHHPASSSIHNGGKYDDEEANGEHAGDVPLLPRDGSQYAYAPASAFDDEGRIMGHQSHDDDASSYVPGGFDPSLIEEGQSVVSTNVRYGRIPQRVPRRYKTLKRVELFHGNLVLDCPTAPALLEKVNDRESREMTHARYSAVTCDADDFVEERYTLRQVLFDPPRRTELMICLTMYNEDEVLFCRTLHGVLTNIAFLCR